MTISRQRASQAILLLFSAGMLSGQEPAIQTTPSSKPSSSDLTDRAIAGSKQDPAAVQRGSLLYGTYCAGCHGVAGRGGAGAPDLIRSLVVLDDEKGILISPVIRDGRPDKGMPKLGLAEPQISDLVAWLHAKTYAAGHRVTYDFKDILTGDPKKGEAYFNGAGTCSTCHSASKDLAHIAAKMDPLSLQSRWLGPRSARTVTVTPAAGPAVSGKLDRIDDFNVSLTDAAGNFHSFSLQGGSTKVTITDPLQAHTDLLRKYTDADIHNVTAYLASLK